MPDKFGAAMALVKSDIGGNISVCFCHLLLSYVLIRIFSGTCVNVSSYACLQL